MSRFDISSTANRLVKCIEESVDPVVIVGVGIPGSGKTTVLTELSRTLEVKRLSADEAREQLTGNMAIQRVNREAWELVNRKIHRELQLGRSVIVDATNAEAPRRRDDVRRYREWGAATVGAVYFNTPFDLSLKWNNERKRVVPIHALHRMQSALEDQPPSIDEGYNWVEEVVISTENSNTLNN